MQNPYDDFRGNISKSTGKTPAFLIFLDEVGREKFRREYGRTPFIRDEGDKAILHAYYQALTPEERQYYKNKERNAPENTQPQYLRRREAQNAALRRNMHADIEGSLEAKEKHKAKIQETQNAKIQANGPMFLEKRRTIFDPNLLLDRDFKMKRITDRNRLIEALKFNLIGGNTDIVLDQQFCFVGATPSFFVVVEVNKELDLVTVPLELSVVRFTLRRGIISRHTYHMNIDPATVLSAEEPDMVSHQREKSKTTARLFGFEGDYTDDALMEGAWSFVKENCPKEAKVVCDTDNYNFIAMSLRLLANRVSSAEGHYAQEHFGSRIYCIEDIALAYKDVSGKAIDDSLVHTFFQRDLATIDAFCPVHGEMLPDNLRRYCCQEARAALNIQRLIDFLRSQSLHDMGKIFDASKHTLCQELVEGVKLPRMPKHSLLSHEELGKQRLDQLMFSEVVDDQEEAIDPITRRKVVESLRGQDANGFRQQNDISIPGPSNMNPSIDIPGPSTTPLNNWVEPLHSAPPVHVEVEEPPPPKLGSTARHPYTTSKYKQAEAFEYSWAVMDEEFFCELLPFLGTSPEFTEVLA